jgi:drug/metabolite transporter (DMT)-like permease
MIHVRSDFFKGFFWSLAGTVVVSTNFVTAKYGLEGFNVETFSFVWTSAAAAYSLFIVLAMGYRKQLVLPGYTILGAFLGPTASWLLLYRSFRYWGLSRATLVMTAQPLFILPMGYLAFGKLPTQKELLGGFMILAGAFWFIWIHFMRKEHNGVLPWRMES